MKRFVLALVVVVAACVTKQTSSFVTVPWSARVYEIRNGNWFDGQKFVPRTVYTVYGHLSDRRPEPVDSVIDLAGAFVVPPFGEAHNHNAVPSDTGVSNRYLKAGIFYVKNPNNFARDRDAAAGVFGTPKSIDVTFANGGFTGPGGHPLDLARRNIARGVWKPEDGEGSFYYTVATKKDVDSKWPVVLATKPYFIKTYLLFSEEYEARLKDSATLGWRGLDPKLLPYIVKEAHEANLSVATHVETAADFRAAVKAGTDEINHLPGFRPEGNDLGGYAKLDRYRINAQDAREAARHHVTLVTTSSEILEILNDAIQKNGPDAVKAKQVRDMIVDNLRVLRDAGVRIVLGSDRYRASSAQEFAAMRTTGLFSDTALLKMWSMDTPKEIFPRRDIGSLTAGSEASFLVLDANPLVDATAVNRIRLRMKQGLILN